MEVQVPFKVYTFWGDNVEPEVRRFFVGRSMINDFNHLNVKLLSVFPGLKGKTYSITWKDEDNDDITISSDGEYDVALTSMLNGPTFVAKFYVHCREIQEDDCDIVITAVNENAMGNNDIQSHFGVMCDGCDRPVRGFRYKCTTCDDFDLCSQCEGSGLHAMHCMVRIPSPVMPRHVIKAAIKRSRHFLKTVTPTIGEEHPLKKHRRDKSGDRKHRERHHGGDHRRRQCTSWLETFANYMNEFANLAGDIDINADKKNVEKPKEQGTQVNTAENVTQKSSENLSQSPQCPFMPIDVNIEQIQKFMEYLQVNAFPQPSTSKAADSEMGQGDRRTPETDKVSVKSEASSSPLNAQSQRDVSPDKAEGWTMIIKEKDLMDTDVPNGQVNAPIGFNLPVEFQQRVNISEGQNLYPPLNSATAVLNPQEAIQQPSTSAGITPSAPRHQQPSQPQPQRQQQPQPTPAVNPNQQIKFHHNPKVDSAIKQMLAMGFTNVGGWLTQLCETHDGDISAVLDLLTPVNTKK